MRNLETRIWLGGDDEIEVDNFAGGGGASTGMELALGRSPAIAVNHDPEAVALHALNHPDTHHLCEDVYDVDPHVVLRGRRVGLAWFSPDCTYFSKARGAKPLRSKERRVRGLAWVVIRWAAAVRPRVIILENVEEFQDWGPVVDERPDPTRRGHTYRAWKARLVKLGYTVEEREIRACDYGAPTTRKRLYVMARCDGRPIEWPEPTHGPGRANPYRTAGDCIDFSIPAPSIFGRRRPLADATMRRVARGTFKYAIECPDPFVVPLGYSPGLAAPTLIQTSWGERPGQAPRVPGLEKPLGTIMAGGGKHALVLAFLAKHYGGHETPGSAMSKPFHTITCIDHHALVTSHISKLYGTSTGSSMAEPLHTITAEGNHFAEVRAFLVKYYGTSRDGQGLKVPLDTITTKPRFGLVTVAGEDYAITDIGMRMLVPRELYSGQGFPRTYKIDATYNGKPLPASAQTRMCGNSVSPIAAAALIGANYGPAYEQRWRQRHSIELRSHHAFGGAA